MVETIINYFDSIPSHHRAIILVGGITFFWMLEGWISFSYMFLEAFARRPLSPSDDSKSWNSPQRSRPIIWRVLNCYCTSRNAAFEFQLSAPIGAQRTLRIQQVLKMQVYTRCVRAYRNT